MNLAQLETEAAKSVEVLPKLMAELAELKIRCVATEQLIDGHKRTILQAKFGVAPGVLVVSGAKVYQVREVSTLWGHERPWLTAQLRKKDGSFSTRVRDLYSAWELVKQ